MKEHLLPCIGFSEVHQKRPDELEGEFNPAFFPRLAVAWGLTFPPKDIGNVSRPSDIEDVEGKQIYQPKNEFISKDMV